MLTLPNYSEDSIEVEVLKTIKNLHQDAYFITTKFIHVSNFDKEELNKFILDKIKNKPDDKHLKFRYKQGDLSLIFTLYPINKPVNKKFSLINEFVKLCQS